MGKFRFVLAAFLAFSIQIQFITSSFASTCDGFFGSKEEKQEYLKKRYGINPSELQFSVKDGIPVLVRGSGYETLAPKLLPEEVIRTGETYDVVVVGGGPAGMISALYLTDTPHGGTPWKVLLLEREAKLGGLASGSELNGIRVGAGAAYSAGPGDLKQYRIFQHIGLGDYKKKLSIHDPIDSFLWNGELYPDVWEEPSLEELPASFELAKHAIIHADDLKMFSTDSPMGKETDQMDWATFVRKMPEMISKLKDRKSKEIYDRFLYDPKVNRADPMADTLLLFDNYGRSALGGTSEQISARQFGDFYRSELEKRYTGMFGTGEVTEALRGKLQDPKRELNILTNAPVASIKTHETGATVVYVQAGKFYEVKTKKVVFAAPAKLAPKLITDFSEKAPDRTQILNEMPITDYAVHIVRVKGHPFRETYDLWIRDKNYSSENDPTDIILGRWMDPKIKGYEGMRDFENHPEDDYGVFTIYQPLGSSHQRGSFSEEDSVLLAEHAVRRMKEILEPLLKERWGTEIEVELVETNRWPYSIHIVRPGEMERTEILAKPFGNIHFANNNLGAPELEEALERGYDAALRINRELIYENASTVPPTNGKIIPFPDIFPSSRKEKHN